MTALATGATPDNRTINNPPNPSRAKRQKNSQSASFSAAC
jgi:hypothetical protein